MKMHTIAKTAGFVCLSLSVILAILFAAMLATNDLSLKAFWEWGAVVALNILAGICAITLPKEGSPKWQANERRRQEAVARLRKLFQKQQPKAKASPADWQWDTPPPQTKPAPNKTGSVFAWVGVGLLVAFLVLAITGAALLALGVIGVAAAVFICTAPIWVIALGVLVLILY